MKENKYRSAADVVTGALSGRSAETGAPLADAGRWAQLALALKMAELEEKWNETAGSPVAQRSRPASCDASGDTLNLMIFVADQTVLSAVRFRKNQLERRLSAFFGAKVKTEFKIGPIKRPSAAKDASAAADRRAPVILDEDQVDAETRLFSDGGLSAEAAEKFARIKLTLEKLSKRKNAMQKE